MKGFVLEEAQKGARMAYICKDMIEFDIVRMKGIDNEIIVEDWYTGKEIADGFDSEGVSLYDNGCRLMMYEDEEGWDIEELIENLGLCSERELAMLAISSTDYDGEYGRWLSTEANNRLADIEYEMEQDAKAEDDMRREYW